MIEVNKMKMRLYDIKFLWVELRFIDMNGIVC